jgi:hypothetical protein
MNNDLDREQKARNILKDFCTDNSKLYQIFQLYKDDIKKDYPHLYYALLGWQDSNIY